MLGLSYYHGQIAVAHFICCLIAGLTVCTRVYAKRSTKQGLRRDDYLIVWTLIVYWAAIIVALHESFTNFGPYTKTEILDMHLTAASPRLIQYRKAMLTAFLLGIWSQFTCKLSILLFYRRIFRTCTFHQRASLYLIIFTSLWWATAVAAMIFVCRSFVVSSHSPTEAVKVAAEREKWKGKWPQVFQAFLALDAANDLAILLVPIRTAFTLQMARRAKVELVSVFALGGFVVVTNVVRIVEFYTRRKEDPNETALDVGLDEG
ncbi:uncharacterized protein J4E92_003203 [Alternaria infectoria]|uniref:uncharacterized protein n=1 Tax=Alternaria infectoria TaxID=45303 RepID=UPI00221E3979|nr:uncharacterized protein J4E92_003203 [Alternaria infectoria]KAI4933536.1 hypothetical protein J4E92_003203 [Alternaria infectoria]